VITTKLDHPGGIGDGDLRYIKAFYNSVRRHSALDYRGPIGYEGLHTTTNTAA
jgi:hypothetical protein